MAIYIFCRPDDILMRQVASYLIDGQTLNEIRTSLLAWLPQWVVYSLPGGLWTYAALLASSLTIEQLKGPSLIKLWLAVLVVPIGMELCQLLHITDGTFDWVDMLFFVLGLIAATLTLKLVPIEQRTQHIIALKWRWVLLFFVGILVFGNQWMSH